jgi:hypothetical protein
MIVDAARDRRIYGLILEYFYSQHSCLFAGTLAPNLQVVAPYLIQLEYDDPKTRRFIMQAWGNSWGVFLRSGTRQQALRRHLRTILVARDESNKRFMFRYYDPRILRVYLPTCTGEELRTVFGPIDSFLVEESKSTTLSKFTWDNKQLDATKFSLDQSGQLSRTGASR